MNYEIEDVKLIAKTDKAILVREIGIDESDVEDDVNQWWIPLSVVADSDLTDIGDEGCVEVYGWWAEKMGRDDEHEE